jgi:Na+/glutamate symporter
MAKKELILSGVLTLVFLAFCVLFFTLKIGVPQEYSARPLFITLAAIATGATGIVIISIQTFFDKLAASKRKKELHKSTVFQTQKKMNEKADGKEFHI